MYRQSAYTMTDNITFNDWFEHVKKQLEYKGYKGHVEKQTFWADYERGLSAGQAAQEHLATLSD